MLLAACRARCCVCICCSSICHYVHLRSLHSLTPWRPRRLPQPCCRALQFRSFFPPAVFVAVFRALAHCRSLRCRLPQPWCRPLQLRPVLSPLSDRRAGPPCSAPLHGALLISSSSTSTCVIRHRRPPSSSSSAALWPRPSTTACIFHRMLFP